MDDHERLMEMCEERNLTLKVVETDGGFALQVCGPRGGVRMTEPIGDDGNSALRALVEALDD